MFAFRPLVTLFLAASLVSAAPAAAMDITLSPEETEALKLKLIAAKPNLSTVTVASFLFPGSAQAYMGHVDRSLLMWGTYLAAFTGLKIAIPDTNLTAGQRTSDVAVVGVFMTMAAISAFDAFRLAQIEREGYDRLINRLVDKSNPGFNRPLPTLTPAPTAPPRNPAPGLRTEPAAPEPSARMTPGP